MASALSDFARRPPGTRAAVYVGVAAALGLLYWQFGLSPVRSSVKAAEAELESEVGNSRRLAKEKKERDELIATQEQLKVQIEQNQKALPTDAEMPAFFDMLARKFAEAGVQVNRRTVKTEISVENFVKAPVDVEIVGTYYQIKQFFASLRPRTDATAAQTLINGKTNAEIASYLRGKSADAVWQLVVNKLAPIGAGGSGPIPEGTVVATSPASASAACSIATNSPM